MKNTNNLRIMPHFGSPNSFKDFFIEPATPTIDGKELNEALSEHRQAKTRIIFGHIAARVMVGIAAPILWAFTHKALPRTPDLIATFGLLATTVLAIQTLWNLKAGKLPSRAARVQLYGLEYLKSRINAQSNPRLVHTRRKGGCFRYDTISLEWDGVEKSLSDIKLTPTNARTRPFTVKIEEFRR